MQVSGISGRSRQGSVLVCENDPKDLKTAVSVVRSFGMYAVVAFESSSMARQFLDGCMAGTGPVPDLLVVDLDLHQESGYELVRYWRSTPKLTEIPLIVWSVLPDEHAEVCQMFKVSRFVSKSDGKKALEDAIRELLPLT